MLGYPWSWSPLQVVYDPARVANAPDSWDVLVDPASRGRVVIEEQRMDLVLCAGRATGAARSPGHDRRGAGGRDRLADPPQAQHRAHHPPSGGHHRGPRVGRSARWASPAWARRTWSRMPAAPTWSRSCPRRAPSGPSRRRWCAGMPPTRCACPRTWTRRRPPRRRRPRSCRTAGRCSMSVPTGCWSMPAMATGRTATCTTDPRSPWR